MPAIDFITELIPTYLERITLAVGGAIGGAWAVAFDGVHLSIDWLLVFMFSDYIAGLYKAFVSAVRFRCRITGFADTRI